MSHYRGTAGAPDKAKAIGAVLLVHVALAAGLLAGLNVRLVQQSIERLKTFDIVLPKPPPPPPPPPPAQKAERAKEKEGAAAKKAVPTEVVAPRVKPLQPPKIAAAPVPSTGTAASAGASTAGSGTGAGGSGNGLGGGGTGARDYSRFTPAQLVRNITRGDYRAIAGDRMPQGIAMLSLRVEPDGTADNCRVVRSSGDSFVDGALCPLVTQRLRFRPARDDQGRAIAYQLQYVARWSL
ncbi:MAG: TonB family protein [Sphingomicrobium sp.]